MFILFCLYGFFHQIPTDTRRGAQAAENAPCQSRSSASFMYHIIYTGPLGERQKTLHKPGMSSPLINKHKLSRLSPTSHTPSESEFLDPVNHHYREPEELVWGPRFDFCDVPTVAFICGVLPVCSGQGTVLRLCLDCPIQPSYPLMEVPVVSPFPGENTRLRVMEWLAPNGPIFDQPAQSLVLTAQPYMQTSNPSPKASPARRILISQKKAPRFQRWCDLAKAPS